MTVLRRFLIDTELDFEHAGKPSPLASFKRVIMYHHLKQAILLTAKYLGAFRLARVLTRNELRILCYHGIALEDEHHFRGRLFMSSSKFQQRMSQLRQEGYRVLPISEAIQAMYAGALPKDSVVLTFDDGWYGFYRHAFPLLQDLRLPVTVYVTSYYCEKETQVFNVALQYLLWRTPIEQLDLSNIDPSLAGTVNLSQPAGKTKALDAVQQLGDQHLDAAGRQHLLETVAEALQIDSRSFRESGCFRLMNRKQLLEINAAGVDIQLHTHRHAFHGLSEKAVRREIEDNRAALEPITGAGLAHFCYPSGRYRRDIFPVLEKMGIETATTCLAGLNGPGTHPLELRRILDEESLTPLEFEAELSGFLDLFRRRRHAPNGHRVPHEA